MSAQPARITGANDTTGDSLGGGPFLLGTEQTAASVVGTWTNLVALPPECRVIRAIALTNPIKLCCGPGGVGNIVTLQPGLFDYFIVPQNSDGTGLVLSFNGMTGVGNIFINPVI